MSFSRVTLPSPPRGLMGRGARVDTATAVCAGVRYESIESMKGVDQLDLLDQDRAVIVAGATRQVLISESSRSLEQLADLLQPIGAYAWSATVVRAFRPALKRTWP